MRSLVPITLLLSCAISAVAASKPIAKMQLPCPAYYQTPSPDGTQLVVSCRDMSMVVLGVPEGRTLRTILAAQKPNASAYSLDGKWLAIGYGDGSVEVTSTRGAAPAQRWQGGPRRIDLLSFLPDGKLLVIAGGDTAVRFYDTATWQKTHENRDFLLESFALQFTPDGKQVLVGGADARITVLDAATAKQVKQLPADGGSYIVGLALLGDQRSAATVYLDDAGHKPPHAVVWDLASGKSSTLGDGVVPTCGEKVAGKLWMCSADGKTLTVSQYD